MRRLFAFFLLLVLAFAIFQPARAQSAVEVTDWSVDYDFGGYVNFKARLVSPSPVTDAVILFRAQGETNTRSERITISPEGNVDFTYTFAQGPIRPFARVNFWFYVTLQNGEQVNTPENSFVYADDRFPWQTLEDGNLRAHWYAGDVAFGQAALDTARTGLQRTSEKLSVSLNRPLDMYIYSTAADLQTALDIGGQTAMGGHASPDLGVALVSIAPGDNQGTEMDREIPHELAHILTYELTGERYSRLPVWLREGIASMAELSPNPDHARAISLAVEKRALIPITELCGSFPPDMARIFLAYAESVSFTRFISNKYGTTGLVSLIQAYADGLDCEQGAAKVFARPLSQVESDWRASELGENKGAAALQNLFPYIAVLGIILVVPLALALTSPKRLKDEF
jgi:hypothetical protein